MWRMRRNQKPRMTQIPSSSNNMYNEAFMKIGKMLSSFVIIETDTLKLSEKFKILKILMRNIFFL